MSTTEALQREAFDKLHPKNDEVPSVLRESFFFLFSKGWEAVLAATSAPAAPVVTREWLESVKSDVNTVAALSMKSERYAAGALLKQKIADALATSAPSEPAGEKDAG